MFLRFVTNDCRTGQCVNRREWLRIGTLAGMGLAARSRSRADGPLAASVTKNTERPAGFGRARSVIVLCASGGQSQLETWDPKPDAPAEIRGEFSSISTSVAGVRVCEHLPQIARLANQFTIIRSMSHDDLDHGSALYLSLTGQFHPRKSSNFPPRSDDAPALGAILQRIRPTNRFPYTAINLNGPVLIPDVPSPGQYGGFLGRSFEPMTIGDVTDQSTIFDGLEPHLDLPPKRQAARTTLLNAIDRSRHQFEVDRSAMAMSELYRQAYSLLESPQCRQAFDLTQESDRVRDRFLRRHSSGPTR